ncbi:DUF559 domain-containing protein [Microbacterium sp. Root166]|uniref:DUF559 domain-containing protein n=1 Tax=Microbacterium sp. Root166 TaxID=1736478 RepID=UPI001F3F8119|nr:DUF559 domain-containing protein [Microbacterium sp. Root166]
MSNIAKQSPALIGMLAAVRRGGGVARARTLIDAGHSRYTVRRAVESGQLIHVRRDWVALPEADHELVWAVRAGVVVSCVSQAKRLGLWVLRVDRPHAAVVGARRVRAGNATVHWAEPVVPRHPDVVVDPIENVLALVASCQPFEMALAVWESALRGGMVARASLERLPLGAQARRILGVASPWSDSGLESFVVPRLRWMRLPIVPQAWIAGHRVDFLIGERLVLQIDGGHHVGAQRAADIEHDAQLMLLGYHVIRVDYRQVVDRWHIVQDTIMRAVAQGLHLAG